MKLCGQMWCWNGKTLNHSALLLCVSLIVLFLIARLWVFYCNAFILINTHTGIFPATVQWPPNCLIHFDTSLIFEEQKNEANVKARQPKMDGSHFNVLKNVERNQHVLTRLLILKISRNPYNSDWNVTVLFSLDASRIRGVSWISHTWKCAQTWMHVQAFRSSQFKLTNIGDNINLFILKWINTWAQLCN